MQVCFVYITKSLCLQLFIIVNYIIYFEDITEMYGDNYNRRDGR